MAKPFIIYAPRHFAQNLGSDPRTIVGRLERLGIEPFAIDVTGTLYFQRDALEKLEAAELGEAVAAQEVTP